MTAAYGVNGGLSPLARGTRHFRFSDHAANRFIPAGAGNTIMRWLVRRSISVYPRWRGEHGCVRTGYVLPVGLSPLARGTPAQTEARKRELRFIPAGAGNTRRLASMWSWTAVYPRWRGEHCGSVNGISGVSGLSPLARGTRRQGSRRRTRTRFIPAGAGNTFSRNDWTLKKAVYPRWRGEHN